VDIRNVTSKWKARTLLVFFFFFGTEREKNKKAADLQGVGKGRQEEGGRNQTRVQEGRYSGYKYLSTRMCMFVNVNSRYARQQLT
jgi:hypothetical protein